MAGLIPQAFIDDLLSRVDIVDVIDKRVKLKKTGKNYSALCPFHTEKSPSFSVEPDKQFYYCFGCGAGGNALGFVMDYERMEFPQAVEALAGDYGIEVPREEGEQHNKRASENKKVFDILESANQYYQLQLRKHSAKKTAVDYLKTRGLTGQIAKHFGIGFAPPGWDNLLKTLDTGDGEIEQMLKAGLLIKREQDEKQQREGQYDRFRDRIMFPIRDSRGRVLGFGGRVLTDEKPKYLNSPETPVYHKGNELYGLYEAKRSNSKLKRFIIVEGYMDVLALAQHGITYAVATLGTATSDTHLTRLFRLAPNVIYCFDGDAAGRTAAWRGLEATLPILQDGRQARFLFLPEGEDPDTLIRKIGHDRFSTMIDNATPLANFFFEHLSQDIDTSAIDGKAKLSSLAIPLLRKLPEGIYRQLMLDKLAEMAGVSSQSIETMISKSAAKAAPPAPQEPAPPNYDDIPEYGAERSDYPSEPDYRRRAARPSPPKPQKASSKSPGLKAIELLLLRPEIALDAKPDEQLLRENGDQYTDLLLELIELVQHTPTIETYTLLGHFYGTTVGNELTQLIKNEKITPHEGVASEFLYLIDTLTADARKKRTKKEIMEKIRPKLKSSQDPI
jgi:DNA primase